jgi:hypothetical protein
MSRQSIPDHWTPVQRAAWRTVHEFRRGAQSGANAIGPLVGKAPGTISNEVNPDVPSHKLGLDDAVALQHATADYRILGAMASSLHHIAMPLPDYAPCSDVELLIKFSEWQARMGRTCEHIHDALADSKITQAEADRVRRAGHHQMRAFFEFLHRLETLVEEGES